MRIWVTRTAPDTAATARRLEQLGHEVVVVPVLAVRRIESDARRLPAAIVFSSANGVRHHHAHAGLLRLPVFAVGDRTAEAAREAGYGNVVSADGDVTSLQRLILRSLPPSRIVHFCGREVAGDLAGFLGSHGYEVERRTIYAAEPVPLRSLVDVRRSLDAIDGIMVHSPRAAARVAKLLIGTGWTGRIWCISQACALELAGTTGVKLFFAGRPTEAAMIEMVQDSATTGPVQRVTPLNRTDIIRGRPARLYRLPSNDNAAHGRFDTDNRGVAPEGPDCDPPPAA